MSSCTVLELDHCTSLKRTVQNSGEEDVHCTSRGDQTWCSKYLHSVHF